LKSIILFLLTIIVCTKCAQRQKSIDFTFSNKLERIWIGPDFWANRLQDWEIREGKVICNTSSPNRNLFLLTSGIGDQSSFQTSVTFGFIPNNGGLTGSVGLRLGIKGEFGDYRDDAVRGKGTDVVILTNGYLKIQNSTDTTLYETGILELPDIITLNLSYDSNNLSIEIQGKNDSGSVQKIIDYPIDAKNIMGGLALVSDFESKDRYNTTPSAWFSHWSIQGKGVETDTNRQFGPILFAQHTLSGSILKINAQMTPGNSLTPVSLEIKEGDQWIKKASADIDPVSRTALLEVEEWKEDQDTPYRISFEYADHSGKIITQYFEGEIKRNPVSKEEIVIAAFTGNNDLGFPNQDLVENVTKQEPDFLFFSGDQIYESVGGYGVQRKPENLAILDYLRKWYLFGWTYRDLMRSVPAVSITDDHDVFHGNIWGESGKATPGHLEGTPAQDQGGYKMPPKFVNMVQRTQTAHLPAPFDPAPVQQGIGVYYTSLNYGGISFGIIEDRKFKSAPKPLLPEAEVWNGWPQNKNYKISEADHPQAKLLGNRQLAFLDDWVRDWSDGIWMKVLLSQTIFANVATLPEEEVHDQNVPKLRILKKNEYAPNDRRVTDMDSNGWPQSGRNKAIRIIRKGFVLHIAGDQHLGSTIQYGVDEFRDAGYAICVPSVSNVWPRRWYPPFEGENPIPGNPPYTGDYEDGFGNKMTVFAVSNPEFTGRKPGNLYDRATGYGIITINRLTRDIKLENWPRNVDPTQSGARPYPGWPVLLNQKDNYKPVVFDYLPLLVVKGMENPVIQVIETSSNEMVYILRLTSGTFKPPVYQKGTYSITIGDPDDEFRTIKKLVPGSLDTVFVNF